MTSGEDIRWLLPDSALEKTASLLNALESVEATDTGLTQSARVFFLSNFTVNLIDPFLRFHLFRSLIRPDVRFGDFNIIHQELLDEDSRLHAEPVDVIVLSLMLDQLDPGYGDPGWTADRTIEEMDGLLRLISDRASALVVINTFIPPFVSPQGLAVSPDEARIEEEVYRINSHLRQFVQSHGRRFILTDWERLVRILGRESSMDDRFRFSASAPFRNRFLDLYAREITKAVRALKGMARKCVVLDCDNTLWGGIIGEDGIDGILLHNTEWPGRAYLEFQKSVLALHRRGILVALCSKNNEDDVWEVLDGHPHCPLDRSHLAAWRINWDNKARNIAELADEMNLGLDSFVVVDDSDLECDLIRQTLPDVTVLQVPDTLYRYPEMLFEDGLFDNLTVSREDRERAVMVRQEKERQSEVTTFEDIGEFLKSLDTVATIRLAGEQTIPRVAQLTQKTNQFNLTTKRYSAAEIEHFVGHPDWLVLTMSVGDRFGNMGLTGVFMARREGDRASIDTLLLSCRILGRELEFVFIDHCMRLAEDRWGILGWKAEYIPTRKNAQVAGFWEKVGLRIAEEDDAHTTYTGDSTDRPAGYREHTRVEWEPVDDI